MTKYEVDEFSTLSELKAAIEAVDNTTFVKPLVIRQNYQIKYLLVTGGEIGSYYDMTAWYEL